jgi:hypothetical protein
VNAEACSNGPADVNDTTAVRGSTALRFDRSQIGSRDNLNTIPTPGRWRINCTVRSG